jgi:hypothetical protein
MIQELEALAEIRGSLKHLAMTLQAIRPRVDVMEEGLGLIVEQHGRMVEYCELPPAPMPRQPDQLRYYRAARTAVEKARCAVVATAADMDALMETLDNTIDRLNVAAYTVAADSTTDNEGTDDAAV